MSAHEVRQGHVRVAVSVHHQACGRFHSIECVSNRPARSKWREFFRVLYTYSFKALPEVGLDVFRPMPDRENYPLKSTALQLPDQGFEKRPSRYLGHGFRPGSGDWAKPEPGSSAENNCIGHRLSKEIELRDCDQA